MASRRSITAGNSSYSTRTRSAASCAAAIVSATTIATGSPTCITFSPASEARDGRMARHASDVRCFHVFGCEHGQHFLGLARLVGIDRRDAGVRMRRSHEGGIGCVGKARIVHKTAGAPDESVILNARRVLRAGGAGCHERSENALVEPLL